MHLRGRAVEQVPTPSREQGVAAEQHITKHEADVPVDVPLGQHRAPSQRPELHAVPFTDALAQTRDRPRELAIADHTKPIEQASLL